MATIYLLTFNNYYNRQVKRIKTPINEDNIEEAGGTIIERFLNINFKWNDGISNELILNYDAENDIMPDYCWVKDRDNGKDSLWFILEGHRTRNGQFRFVLYRDLVNTYYDDIIESPCFIEKATLSKNNNLIFNSENMSYNQIKQWETPIHDSSTFCWLIGYMASNTSDKTNCTFSTDYDRVQTIGQDHTSWSYAQYTINNPLKLIKGNDFLFNIFTRQGQNSGWYGSVWFDQSGNRDDYGENFDKVAGAYVYALNSTDIQFNWFNIASVKSAINTAISGNSTSENDYMAMRAYDNATIKFSDGTYVIHVLKKQEDRVKVRNTFYGSAPQTQYIDYMQSILRAKGYNFISGAYNKSAFGYECDVESYYLEFEPVSEPSQYKYSIPSTTRTCIDADYKLFAIPYKSCYSFVKQFRKNTQWGSTEFWDYKFDIDEITSLAWMNSIAKELGTSLYDCQILPYTFLITEDITTELKTPEEGKSYVADNGYGTEGVDYIYLKDSSNKVVNICYFAKKCNFIRSIVRAKNPSDEILIGEYNIVVNNMNNIDFKVSNETDVYRLCSPNQASIFEISATRNGGLGEYTAECTYKPYNPFICVHPKFNKLYGGNFRDNRGLVLSGDFSLPIISNEWKQYEINNKNYELIFNRQIENMEVNNNIAMSQAIAGGVAGIVQGGVSGSITGGMIGGGFGAAIGGMMGTGAAAGGMAGDIFNLKKAQAETLDYTKDLYGYQLGNIKALPNTMTKVGSLIANSKLWPYLEYYTCTEEEKTALRNKLKYNGMTVGAIGKISDYILAEPSYIKGKIIRIENIDIDFHEANMLAEEINKGVFI